MKIMNFFKNKNVSMAIGMVLGTVIYCMGVVFILDLGEFYAGGITGVSQLITNFIYNVTGQQLVGFKSIIIAAFNLPLFLIAWKGVSKRFAVVSLVSVILQVGLIALFEYLNRELGISPFEAFADKNDVGSMLALSILGGLVTGAGCGISLKWGASTGGMDVVSQYVSLKKHVPFTKVSLSIDLAIICFAGIVGSIEIAAYTIIRMIIGILVLDKIYTVYKYAKVTVVTEEKQRLRDALVSSFNHGVTIYSAIGGYTNKPKYVLESVVWAFEISDYVRIAKKVDPNCFISTTAVKKVEGTFRVNVIA